MFCKTWTRLSFYYFKILTNTVISSIFLTLFGKKIQKKCKLPYCNDNNLQIFHVPKIWLHSWLRAWFLLHACISSTVLPAYVQSVIQAMELRVTVCERQFTVYTIPTYRLETHFPRNTNSLSMRLCY